MIPLGFPDAMNYYTSALCEVRRPNSGQDESK